MARKINATSGPVHTTLYITVISPIHKEDQTNLVINMCCGTQMKITADAPLKQFKSGIAAENIQCKTNLALVFKAEDGTPACVKPETSKILVERGWAKPI
ncbi:MAG: hypothetical protein HY222_05030 [Thaumarchaeota archaeon]|nr:hypothetical protein [Nitrososphaerota archaeon]MBI3641739.1 hypothetical protein [Nitrososphaerota archaeon]